MIYMILSQHVHAHVRTGAIVGDGAVVVDHGQDEPQFLQQRAVPIRRKLTMDPIMNLLPSAQSIQRVSSLGD